MQLRLNFEKKSLFFDKMMNYLSFFSGIGGFELAIQNSFGKKAHCCGYSEIDPSALQVYQKHFPDHHPLGDITKITSKQIENIYQRVGHIDLIIGGFPCQNLSQANIRGNRDGLDGEKSGLFFNLLKIIKFVDNLNKTHKRKTFIILENVKTRHHLATEYLEKIFGKGNITGTELDSSPFSAQKRIRFIWTNFPISSIPTKNGPKFESILLPTKAITSDMQMTDAMMKYLNTKVAVPSVAPRPKQELQLVKTDSKNLNYYKIVDKGTSHKHKIRWQLFGISDTNENKSRTICRWDQVVFDHRFGPKEFIVRRLQPEEIERLFTFPTGWTKDVSRTHRLSLLGNAVVVKAIEFITDNLRDFVGRKK
jgi:DNA-cytosine methyltransferase